MHFENKFVRIFVIMLGIPFIFIILLLILKGCFSKKMNYNEYEKKMISAAEKYFVSQKSLPTQEGEENSVSLDTLIKNDYINSPDKFFKGKSCTGNVIVKNNGASVKENDGGFYFYIPYLECSDYKTIYIIDKLKENLVTEKSGLYQVNDELIFKGDKVKNYLLFFDKSYRIVSIDQNGIMKLVRDSSEKNKVIWDGKYNVDIQRSYGINDYSDSYIIDELNNIYLKTSDNQKKHMVAQSICYGNRYLNNSNIDKVNECSKKLDNQFVSLLNTYDFAMASYDKNCLTIGGGACRNYNYLYNTLVTTWLVNGDADNSYKVFYYSQGSVISSKAANQKKFNLVIYLNSKELYTKGDGSKENPYIVK